MDEIFRCQRKADTWAFVTVSDMGEPSGCSTRAGPNIRSHADRRDSRLSPFLSRIALSLGSVFTPGDYSFTVRVTDSVGTYGEFPATWHVTPLAVWNQYPPFAPNIPYLNQSYSQALLVSGGALPYTITPVQPYPVNLTIGPNDPNAVLAGTVLEAGYGMPLDFKVRDSAGNTLTNNSLMSALAGLRF